MTRIVRASIFHTPRSPFDHDDALEHEPDGGLVVEGGRIAYLGSFEAARAAYPGAVVEDATGAVLLPGFVDTHVHYPQISALGGMGLELLQWLQSTALPQEARLVDPAYAQVTATRFVRQLLRNGTTTALVFGSHFPRAQHELFAAAERAGLRLTSGLVVSDANLIAALHLAPADALAASRELIARWHGHGEIRYAVTPRFSVSCSAAMLDGCGELLHETPDLSFTSHVNESRAEIELVARLFPDAAHYLDTYDRHGLIDERAVLAHNVHPSDAELERLGEAHASVAHCASSNALIGSGLFPLRRHLEHRVGVALGSDVGAGGGFNLLAEGRCCYQGQMLQEDGWRLGPEHVLYLATLAGALALGRDDVGDLSAGKHADFVLLRPPPDGTLAVALEQGVPDERLLALVLTLAGEETVSEVFLGGERVYGSAPD